MMKVIKTGVYVDGKEIRLSPVNLDGEILLYDVYLGEKWFGSRRTVDACGVFLGVPDLMRKLWG